MYYSEVLRIKQDEKRVYFEFNPNSNESKILALPKKASDDGNFYAGNSYSQLVSVDPEIVRKVLPQAMCVLVRQHPAIDMFDFNISRQSLVGLLSV
jgi:hypothetical protein